MGNTAAVSAVAILFFFAIGIPVGILLVISLASKLEDWSLSLWDPPPNAAFRGARRLLAATVLGGRPFGGFAGWNPRAEAQGQEPER
jgi:hypothetical protein